MKRPLSLYRLVLWLYPARFREEYGGSLEQLVVDEYRSAEGRWSRFAVCLSILLDLAVSVPRELARELSADVRFAVRIHAKRPLVTLLAVVSLALAIGASTGVFSVVNGLLLRPLPFRGANRLVQLEGYRPTGIDGVSGFGRWRAESLWLEDAVSYTSAEMTLNRESGATRVTVTEATANFFAMLGVVPAAGGGFEATEDEPGRNAIAVLGDGLWRQAFGGDPKVVGSTIRINGTPLTVVGIAPRGFDYPDRTAVWTPTVFDFQRLPKRETTFYELLGRLKPGLSPTQAQGLLEAEIARRDPALLKPEAIANYGSVRPMLVPLREKLAGTMQQASLAMFGAVTFVLLVAAANVAHLLLTRTSDRRKELAIRAALGATRARLLQQLVTEGLVLTGVAGACGLPIAVWVSRLTEAAQPVPLLAQAYAILDWRVLGFAMTLAALTGTAFGVFPALIVARLHPSADIVRPHSGPVGPGPQRLRETLVAIQVALALVLLAGSLSMGRAFVSILRTDLGFRTANVVTMSVSLTGTRYDSSGIAGGQYCRDVLERLRAVPGVVCAGAVDGLPLAVKGFGGTSYAVEGGTDVRLAMVLSASRDYFRTLGTEILFGREFAPGDDLAAEPVAVVNEQFATTSGLGRAILGRRITAGWGGKPRTVVGVTRGLRYAGPTYGGTEQVFAPIESRASGTVWFVARVKGDPAGHLAAYRDAVRSVDRQVGVFSVMTLDDRLSKALVSPRFYTTVALFFGVFALLLAGVGVFGVVSYAVAQRTHEIGVRIALGGAPRTVRRYVLARALAPVMAGACLGVAGSVAVGGVLEHLVAGAERSGAGMSAAAAALLVLTAAAAIGAATRRVLHLQAMDVLRAE